MSMNTQEQLALSSLVVRFGKLEKLLAELAHHANAPIVRVDQRTVTTHYEPIDRVNAYIVVTAIDHPTERTVPIVYFWYGRTGSFDEMGGQPFNPHLNTRQTVARAAALNEEAIRKAIAEYLGDKADVRDGVFILPDNCYSGYGTTELVDMAAPLKPQRQAAG